MVSGLAQHLVDEFNKTYWVAASKSDSKLFFEAALIARQLILELGRENIVHDKLIDPDYTNKQTLIK